MFYLPPHGRRPVRGDPGIEAAAHFTLELRRQFLAQERGDVIRLDGMNCGATEVFINGLEVGLFAENDVGRVLALVHAPVVFRAEGTMDGAEAVRERVQTAVQPLDLQFVGDLLRLCPVGNVGEGIVQQREVDLQLAQLGGQPAVAVEADLQAAGQPGRHAHVAQAQFFVDLVVQTLAIVGPEVGLARLLVVPGFIGRARLHGRQHADKSRMLPTPGQHFLHAILFTEVPLADELDLDAHFGCQPLGVSAQLVAERVGKPRVVKDAHLPLVPIRGHALGVADLGPGAKYQHPVPATQHPGDLSRITLGQKLNVHAEMINNPCFGYGYTGLGSIYA